MNTVPALTHRPKWPNVLLLSTALLVPCIAQHATAGDAGESSSSQERAEPGAGEMFLGRWRFVDVKSQLYVVEIRADQTVRAKTVDGRARNHDATGQWQIDGERLTITYESGAVDVLLWREHYATRLSYGAGMALDSKPQTMSLVFKDVPQVVADATRSHRGLAVDGPNFAVSEKSF